MRKNIIPAIFPGAGGIEDIGELIDQRRFTARLAAEDRHRPHKERFHFRRNIFPVAERVLADLPAANIHKGPLRIDKHRLDPQMLKVLRRIGLFRGIDPVRLDPFFAHKSADPMAPDVPAVRIGLHPLFIEGVDANILLIFKGLQQPAQAVRHRRLLRHGALFKQLAVAGIVIAHNDMQLIDLATGALYQVDMPGMQRVKLTKHHADAFLSAGKFQPEETMQRFKLLRARAFDFGIQQLAKIPLGHSAGFRHLLQGTAFLLNGAF